MNSLSFRLEIRLKRVDQTIFIEGTRRAARNEATTRSKPVRAGEHPSQSCRQAFPRGQGQQQVQGSLSRSSFPTTIEVFLNFASVLVHLSLRWVFVPGYLSGDIFPSSGK